MNFATAQKNIESRLNTNWTTTSIQWENVPFTRPTNTAWIRCTIIPGESLPGIGTAGSDRLFGSLYISIFVPIDTYNKIVLGYVDTLRAVFNRSNSITGMTFSSMRVTSKGVDPQDPTFYQVVLRFPFWFWP